MTLYEWLVPIPAVVVAVWAFFYFPWASKRLDRDLKNKPSAE